MRDKISMAGVDAILSPTNPYARAEFDNQRLLIKKHFRETVARFVEHSELIRDIEAQILDAQAFGAALRCVSVPTLPAHKAIYDCAVMKALESRVAFTSLRTLLRQTCGSKCAPLS